MSFADRLREHVEEHQGGIVADMLFAVVWVTVASLLYELSGNAPRWVLWMYLLAGVPAYFLFFWSWELAKHWQNVDEES